LTKGTKARVPGKRFPTGSALSRENLRHICHVTIPSFLSVCVRCEFSLEEGHFVNMYTLTAAAATHADKADFAQLSQRMARYTAISFGKSHRLMVY
jgi:hypothetical protein